MRRADGPQGRIVVFAEIESLRWVVRNRWMAFSEGLSRRAARIRSDDQLVLYVAHGAFHNPTRDRPQIAGMGTVAGPVQRFRRPVEIARRGGSSQEGRGAVP